MKLKKAFKEIDFSDLKGSWRGKDINAKKRFTFDVNGEEYLLVDDTNQKVERKRGELSSQYNEKENQVYFVDKDGKPVFILTQKIHLPDEKKKKAEEEENQVIEKGYELDHIVLQYGDDKLIFDKVSDTPRME